MLENNGQEQLHVSIYDWSSLLPQSQSRSTPVIFDIGGPGGF